MEKTQIGEGAAVGPCKGTNKGIRAKCAYS